MPAKPPTTGRTTRGKAVDYSGMDSDKTTSTKEDPTFRGNRTVGDSGALAKARFNLKPKPVDFKNWKKGREAQHLIPASLHKTCPALVGVVDDRRNGMMLPTQSTYNTPGNSPIFKSPAKQKRPIHLRGKNRDHPTYTKNVKGFIRTVEKSGRNLNQGTLFMVMDALRGAHKDIGKTGKSFVDDITEQRMKSAWNSQNPAYKLK